MSCRRLWTAAGPFFFSAHFYDQRFSSCLLFLSLSSSESDSLRLMKPLLIFYLVSNVTLAEPCCNFSLPLVFPVRFFRVMYVFFPKKKRLHVPFSLLSLLPFRIYCLLSRILFSSSYYSSFIWSTFWRSFSLEMRDFRDSDFS